MGNQNVVSMEMASRILGLGCVQERMVHSLKEDEAMKDADQVKALALIMGWEQEAHIVLDERNVVEKRYFSIASETGQVWYPRVFTEWNPLTNIADCWQVVEMMRASDWRYMIGSNGNNEGYYCHFWTVERLGGIRAWSNDMLRAICEAVLKAHGKWVEE